MDNVNDTHKIHEDNTVFLFNFAVCFMNWTTCWLKCWLGISKQTAVTLSRKSRNFGRKPHFWSILVCCTHLFFWQNWGKNWWPKIVWQGKFIARYEKSNMSIAQVKVNWMIKHNDTETPCLDLWNHETEMKQSWYFQDSANCYSAIRWFTAAFARFEGD